MALHLIRSDELFTKLKITVDPERLASDFVHKYADDSTCMNIQLTELIFKLCKLSCSLPTDLVVRNDVKSVVYELENLIEIDVEMSSSELNISETLRNKVTLFFEHFWSLNWSNIIQEDKFVSYFQELICALSEVKINSLRHLCILIQLQVVTSFLKNRPEHFETQFRFIGQYAHDILMRSAYDTNKQLWVESLSELAKWFSLCPEYMVDKFLRFIVWSLRDIKTSKVVNTGLKIAQKLLEDGRCDLPVHFISKIVETFFEIVKSANEKIFDTICDCCILIHSRFEGYLSADLKNLLDDHVFTLDSNKYEAAARFWVAVHLDRKSRVEILREIITFVKERKTVFVELFVDALTTIGPFLNDWLMIAEVLTIQREDQLNMEEKNILLLLLTFAVRLAITAKRPVLRCIPGMKKQRNEDVSIALTVAFESKIECITSLEFNNPSLLLKLFSYFHFDTLEENVVKRFISSCHLTFIRFYLMPARKSCIELLVCIKERSSDKGIIRECRRVLDDLKSRTESKFENAFEKLLETPDAFRNTEEGQSLRDIMYTLLCLDAVVPISKRIVYDATIYLFKYDIPKPWNSAFIITREILIILSTKYITRNLTKNRQVREEAQHLIYCLASHLNIYYKGRVGEIVFWSLCDLIECMNNIGAMECVPKPRLLQLATYASFILFNIDGRGETIKSDPEEKRMMGKYLKLVEQKILPLDYAYDVLLFYCHDEDGVHSIVPQFFLNICRNWDNETLTNWLFTLLQRIFQRYNQPEKKNALKTVAHLSVLVHLARSDLQDVLSDIHRNGIDYAIANTTHIEFLYILSQFSWCLEMPKKSVILNYFLEKPAVNMEIANLYVKSLRCRTRVEVVPEISSVDSSFELSTVSLNNDSSIDCSKEKLIYNQLGCEESFTSNSFTE